MFFKKYKKRRNCVHRYNVVDVAYKGISDVSESVIKRYILLCNKCEKRISTTNYDYELMLKQGLIETGEEYNTRVSNHVKTKK